MFPAQEFLTLPLLAAALLVLISVVAGVLSARAGFSFLLVFLLAGSLAGEDGPGGFVFNDFKLSFWVGNLALAVILLDGGLRTEFKTFRTGLKPAITLATWGVLVTAGLTGVAAHFLLGLDWYLAMLLGAIVGSTDAAAVFSLLQSSGVRLNERVAATLEIESGLNDPIDRKSVV
jgi:cell volume regulation protein A